MQEERRGERRAPAGEPPGAGDGRCRRSSAAARRRRPRGVGLQRGDQCCDRARPSAPRPRSAAGSTRLGPRAGGGSRSRPCPRGDRGRSGGPRPLARRTASADPSSEALSRTRASRSIAGRRRRLDRVEAGEQIFPPVGVHHAVAELHGENAAPCASSRRPGRLHAPLRPRPGGPLARAGAEVELVTLRVSLRIRAAGGGLRGDASSSTGAARAPARTPKAAAGAARSRARARNAPPPAATRGRPTSSTTSGCRSRRSTPAPARRRQPARLHDALAASPSPAAGSRRPLRPCSRRWTRSSSHSGHGAERLSRGVRGRPGRIEVIPHGAFDYLTRQEDEEPLPDELARREGPVILAFGLIRPYKGTDVLLEAFARDARDAELWIVGMPGWSRWSRCASWPTPRRGRVRFVDRFVPDPEIPAFMRRADVVALPYRNIEQSGVLYTALAFGRPLVLSDVGGFPEVAELGRGPDCSPGRCRGARGGARRAARRSGRARAPRRRRAGRSGGPLLVGRDRAPYAGPLRTPPAAGWAYRHQLAGGPMIVLEIVFWGSARPDRLRPRRLSAAAAAVEPRLRRDPAVGPQTQRRLPSVTLDRGRLRRGGGDRAQGRERARARLPARDAWVIVASDGSSDRTVELRSEAGADLGPRPPARRQGAALNAAVRAGRRRPASPSPTPTASGARRPAAPGRPLRRLASRLRLRPGPLHAAARAATRRASTGATRWRSASWSPASAGSRPGTGRSTRSAARPTSSSTRAAARTSAFRSS